MVQYLTVKRQGTACLPFLLSKNGSLDSLGNSGRTIFGNYSSPDLCSLYMSEINTQHGKSYMYHCKSAGKSYTFIHYYKATDVRKS